VIDLQTSLRGLLLLSRSEEDLIRAAQAGDSEAFCLLAESYQRRVYLLALHY
jgi:hypothetical protein